MIVSDQQWNRSGTLCEVEIVRMILQPTQQQFSSLVLPPLSKKKTIDEELGYWKKNSAAQKGFASVAKHIAAMTHKQTNSNLAAKAWMKERFKAVVMAPCPNINKVLKEVVNVTSTNRCFRTIQHAVASYIWANKKCHSFIRKETFNKIDYTLLSLIYNYSQFKIKYQENGTIMTPLLLIYLDLGLFRRKVFCFMEVHSNEMLQQICSIYSDCWKRGRREPNF